jgi:hypothetical protein
MKGLQASPGFEFLYNLSINIRWISDLYYMDDLMNKWGFGSGDSLFLGAGASWQLVTNLFHLLMLKVKIVY